MAEFTDTISDSVAVTDATRRTLAALRRVSDSVALGDLLLANLLRVDTVTDSVEVTDSLARSLTAARRISDVVGGVVDAVLSQPTIVFKIDEARSLTETKVRIDFEVPTLINDALTRASSYTFHATTPGAVEVTPLSVALPPGQPNPLYVEIATTEHTDGAMYEVALSAELRGAAGQIGHSVPFAYEAIGVAPALQLVIAKSATEAEVHFTEDIENNTAARDRDNYIWAGGISTVGVREVIGNVVVLQTTTQLPGQLYTLTVVGVTLGEDFDIELFTDDVELDEELFATVELELAIDDSVSVADAISRQVLRETLRSVTDTIAIADDVQTLLTVPSGASMPMIFASARPGISPELQVSSDDISWISRNDPANVTNRVLRNGGRNTGTGTIILVGDDGLFMRSTNDGVTWVTSQPMGPTADYYACWFGGGRWFVSVQELVFVPSFAVTSKLWHSTDDGLNWNGPIDPDNGTGTGPTGTATAGASDYFHDGLYSVDLGMHVGVGLYGAIWTSFDAIHWTRRTAAGGYVGGSFGFLGLAYSSLLTLLVAVGESGECQTSGDGSTWTKRLFSASSPTMSTAWSVCWSPTLFLFVAVGESSSTGPSIQTSPNGINWTKRTPAAGTTHACLSCSWDSNTQLFVVTGRFGEVQTSPDGINWTQRTPANTGGDFNGNSASSIFVTIGGGEAT